MTGEQCFEVWAPMNEPWSAWAKPVLFTQLDQVPTATAPTTATAPEPDLFWVPNPDGRTIAIVDLPGVQAVEVGLALARRGDRPIPLFNTSLGPSAVIDMHPVATALREGVERLRVAPVAAGAPPAFLLDSRRMSPAAKPAPGQFDNRWVVFAQDFPSAVNLQSRGVVEAWLLVDRAEPQADLAHVLLRWQQAGIRILAGAPQGNGRVSEIVIRKPSRFRGLLYRVLLAAGLYRNAAGGFGGIVPRPGSGG